MRPKTFALLNAVSALSACAQPSPPAAVTSACPLTIDASFPVTYVDGHLPVITVKIRGKNMRLMVDSGSQGTFLSTAAYNRLHLNQTYNRPGDYSTGLGGNMGISAFALVDMDFGTVNLKDEVVAILTKTTLDETGPNAIDGIMGYDILQYFDIGLDLPHNRITFYTPQHCTIAETPWQGDYAPTAFTRPQAGSPVIPETIDDQNFNVVIDTGAFHSLIMQASLTRAGVKPERASEIKGTALGIGDLKVHILKAQFATLGIGAEVFSNATLALDTNKETDFNEFTDGLLGENYLASHRIFIVNSTDTAYLGLSGE